jgi:hypothetical protein
MSKKETVLKSKVLDHFTLVIDNEDGTPAKTWKLVYDYRAIAKIEDAIGKDIKKIEGWKEISSGKDFPTLVWGGLSKYNPEVTLDEVMDVLNPAAQRILSDEIFELMFPGAKEAYLKSLEAKGASNSPNAPAETPKS